MFIKSLINEYKNDVPKNSVLYELSKESSPGLTLSEIGLRCAMMYNQLKRSFEEIKRKDKVVLKLKKYLTDIDSNRDNISALLLAF